MNKINKFILKKKETLILVVMFLEKKLGLLRELANPASHLRAESGLLEIYKSSKSIRNFEN